MRLENVCKNLQIQDSEFIIGTKKYSYVNNSWDLERKIENLLNFNKEINIYFIQMHT